MALAITAMDRDSALEIAGWRYQPPYDLYNIDGDGLALAHLTRPEAGYYRIDDGDELVGFCCFGEEARVPGGDYGAAAVDIGLGVRPDLTGRGQGRRYFGAVVGFAEREYTPPALRLSVATFNSRAIRLYQSAGFREVQRFTASFSGQPFLVMVRRVGGKS